MLKKKLLQTQSCKSFFLKLYAVFYRPNDSRMLVALGESYEKLSQQAEAKKVGDNCQWTIHPFIPDSEELMLLSCQCYWRAYSVGDVEKMALLKLAK